MYAKGNLVISEVINQTRMCSMGQVKQDSYTDVSSRVEKWVIDVNEVLDINEEDITTGVDIHSGLLYCSEFESMQMYKFLHNLISTQSPRTILLATVNSIQSNKIKESENRKRLGHLYLDLDKKFHFQYGKILTAILSSSEIQTMMAQDWPYFIQHQQYIDKCLNGSNCQRSLDTMKDLGN